MKELRAAMAAKTKIANLIFTTEILLLLPREGEAHPEPSLTIRPFHEMLATGPGYFWRQIQYRRGDGGI
jgi:hypothetical protein